MGKTRLTANIIVIIILLSLIIATAEEDEEKDNNDWDDGVTIIWPASETYHVEWNNQIIPVSGGIIDAEPAYNDHDFEVNDYATGGVIIVDNFQRVGVEDVDIYLFGANVDDNGDRVEVARSTTSDPEEKIVIEGTPDPIRVDDFEKGGNGTWTLRVFNFISPTIAVMYDAKVDIYYDGAEYHYSEEDQDSETRG